MLREGSIVDAIRLFKTRIGVLKRILINDIYQDRIKDVFSIRRSYRECDFIIKQLLLRNEKLS